MKVPTLVKRAERLANKEALSLNKQLFQLLLQSQDTVTLSQSIDSLVVESFLGVLALGAAVAEKSLQNEVKLQLSFDEDALKFVDETVYETFKTYFEYQAQEISADVRADVAGVMIKVSDYAREQGYTPEQTEILYHEVLKSKGFSPLTARNLKTVFTTGLHMSYNGVRYNRAKGSSAVWGFRYETAGDEKVRDTHIAQQGTTLPKEDQFWNEWVPTNGWNCRCTLEILFEEQTIVEPDRTISPDPGFEGNKFASWSGM